MQRRDEQEVAQGGGGTQLSHTARAPEASPLPCPAPSNLPPPHPSSEPLRPLSPPQPPNACVVHTRQQVNPAAPWMALLRTEEGARHTLSAPRGWRPLLSWELPVPSEGGRAAQISTPCAGTHVGAGGRRGNTKMKVYGMQMGVGDDALVEGPGPGPAGRRAGCCFPPGIPPPGRGNARGLTPRSPRQVPGPLPAPSRPL